MAKDEISPIDSGVTASYNGFTFSDVKSVSVRAMPVYSDDGRTIDHVKHTIQITDYIKDSADGVESGTEVNAARLALMEPAGRLVITGSGYGNIDTDTVADIDFGPKPQSFDWKPLGHVYVAEITWVCEVALPNCSDAGEISGYGYSVSEDIESGLTTRTISGYLLIALNRTGRSITKTANNYRGLIDFKLQDGFDRKMSFKESQDGRRLDFTFVDTQIPSMSPYPDGITRISLIHSITTPELNTAQFHGNFSGNFTVGMGKSKEAAWLAFQAVLDARLKKFTKGKGPAGGPPTLLIKQFTMSEDVFGLGASISLSYILTTTLATLFDATGMFEPIPGKWGKWKASLRKHHSNVGVNGEAYDRTADVIVDMCGGEIPQLKEVGPIIGTTTARRPNVLRTVSTKPPQSSSWVAHKNVIKGVTNSAIAVHKSIPKVPTKPSTSGVVGGDRPKDTDGPTLAPKDQQNKTSTTTFQLVAPPYSELTMEGAAVRLGHQIPLPVIEQIRNATGPNGEYVSVFEKSRIFEQAKIGQSMGIDIYGAAWQLTYDVADPPSTPLNTPSNETLERSQRYGKYKPW